MPQSPTGGRKIRLLIVEDEAKLVHAISNYLSSFPGEFEVITVGSGEEGLDVVKQQEIDLLLTDVRLPGIDGTEVVRVALEISPGLKVIVMTAFSSKDLRSKVLRDGALMFVEKPVDLEELRQNLLKTAAEETGWSASVHGLDLFDLTQLFVLVRKTRTIAVRTGNRSGILVFDGGELRHASTDTSQGPEAYYEMVRWEGGTFGDLPDAKTEDFPTNVTLTANRLMLEAARLRDEQSRDDVDTQPIEEQPIEEQPITLPPDLEPILKRFVATSDFAQFACVIDDQGGLVKASSDEQEDMESLRTWLGQVPARHPRNGLRRVLVEDSTGILVLTALGGGPHLMVAARSGAPLAAITNSVDDLEGSIKRT